MIARLQDKSSTLTEDIFGKLTSWQIARLARHPRRPYTLDYIQHIFTEFDELHGDRHFSDDAAIVGGIARLDDQPVMVIGHQKGREVREKVRRNFGMPRPEGYRKACRLMEMAERFKMPILTFIDTPGAYPGIDAEERNQSEAIAWNLRVMSRLKTPIIATVIGEGGSGGALAIGVCDQLNMLQYSTYAVISEEKNKVFRALLPIAPSDVVRGQFSGYATFAGWPGIPTRRPSSHCAAASTTGVGPASRSTCARDSRWPRGSGSSRSPSRKHPAPCSRRTPVSAPMVRTT